MKNESKDEALKNKDGKEALDILIKILLFKYSSLKDKRTKLKEKLENSKVTLADENDSTEELREMLHLPNDTCYNDITDSATNEIELIDKKLKLIENIVGPLDIIYDINPEDEECEEEEHAEEEEYMDEYEKLNNELMARNMELNQALSERNIERLEHISQIDELKEKVNGLEIKLKESKDINKELTNQFNYAIDQKNTMQAEIDKLKNQDKTMKKIPDENEYEVSQREWCETIRKNYSYNSACQCCKEFTKQIEVRIKNAPLNIRKKLKALISHFNDLKNCYKRAFDIIEYISPTNKKEYWQVRSLYTVIMNMHDNFDAALHIIKSMPTFIISTDACKAAERICDDLMDADGPDTVEGIIKDFKEMIEENCKIFKLENEINRLKDENDKLHGKILELNGIIKSLEKSLSVENKKKRESRESIAKENMHRLKIVSANEIITPIYTSNYEMLYRLTVNIDNISALKSEKTYKGMVQTLYRLIRILIGDKINITDEISESVKEKCTEILCKKDGRNYINNPVAKNRDISAVLSTVVSLDKRMSGDMISILVNIGTVIVDAWQYYCKHEKITIMKNHFHLSTVELNLIKCLESAVNNMLYTCRDGTDYISLNDWFERKNSFT